MRKIAEARRQETSIEIARRFGVHPVTVRRLVSLPRAEYESQSLSRRRPWEAEGISRATWYRRRAAGAQGQQGAG